ncbi:MULTISPECIES: helix-turn-helix transcriptional regulator [Bacteria]|jgi:predicted XRE-type DNA-binding protein|uniref:DNA-binding protein n=1 Tax=Bacillus wiedmannii TaxID=1890302 RepID=A0A2A8BMF8_9BACI|nr:MULTISPECIES: DNA-binding protein [Bacteria]MDM5041367.1 DNA-binding protein [Bacillus sp. OR-18]MEB8740801.1 DNA-binding protein [Bacillus cereus]MEB8909578.1 DNA-binding protein [Bacillus cereus]MEB9926278.1 DNA-binding protein [Bacillus cereus]MEB9987202.1 DNA-binding protein [Bacillus cereus]
MYELKNKEDVEKFVNEYILTTSEVLEILNISRPRLNELVNKKGRIVPLKQTKNMSLFWKSDVEQLEKELVELRKKYGPK